MWKAITSLFAPKWELIGISLPEKFFYSYEGENQKFFYVVTLWENSRGARKYHKDVPDVVKKLMSQDTYLEYWVHTGIMDSNYERFFDWKVKPSDLKKRYLADILKSP